MMPGELTIPVACRVRGLWRIGLARRAIRHLPSSKSQILLRWALSGIRIDLTIAGHQSTVDPGFTPEDLA